MRGPPSAPEMTVSMRSCSTPNPVIGGLTIVRAKKYTGVIGVSHIRELVGAMDEMRAGRGILVTTSWFASGCWIKASRERPLIQPLIGRRPN